MIASLWDIRAFRLKMVWEFRVIINYIIFFNQSNTRLSGRERISGSSSETLYNILDTAGKRGDNVIENVISTDRKDYQYEKSTCCASGGGKA